MDDSLDDIEMYQRCSRCGLSSTIAIVRNIF